jgi:hypothetical protein
MNSQLPIAIRATAAALAVFMTMATLDTMISIAEPQQSQLMARNAPRHAVQLASVQPQTLIVASGPMNILER